MQGKVRHSLGKRIFTGHMQSWSGAKLLTGQEGLKLHTHQHNLITPSILQAVLYCSFHTKLISDKPPFLPFHEWLSSDPLAVLKCRIAYLILVPMQLSSYSSRYSALIQFAKLWKVKTTGALVMYMKSQLQTVNNNNHHHHHHQVF